MRKLQYSQFPNNLPKAFTDTVNIKIEQASDTLNQQGNRIDIKHDMELIISPLADITIKRNRSYMMNDLLVICFTFTPNNTVPIGNTYTPVASFSGRASYNEVFKSTGMNGIILKDTNEIRLANTTLDKDKEYSMAITIIRRQQ